MLEEGHSSEDSWQELQVQTGEQPSFTGRQESKPGKSPVKNMPLLHVESKVNEDVLGACNSTGRFRGQDRWVEERWKGEEEKKNLTGREHLPFNKHSAGHVVETLSKERILGGICN